MNPTDNGLIFVLVQCTDEIRCRVSGSMMVALLLFPRFSLLSYEDFVNVRNNAKKSYSLLLMFFLYNNNNFTFFFSAWWEDFV